MHFRLTRRPTESPRRPSRHHLVALFTAALPLVVAPAHAATLSGRTVDPDGRVVSSARVSITTPLAQTIDRASDARGEFTVTGLPPGNYTILATADGLQADAVTVTLGDTDRTDVTLTLRVSAITESIVVSASQVDVPLSRAASDVTVITSADLKSRQIESVADALRLATALNVTRSGGRGAITSLFPRGGASNYTMVLVDGIQANGFGGDYDFGHLSIADVDRIEVARGPESALFGAEAIGAVVEIVTRRGGKPYAGGLFEGGSQGTARGLFETSGSSGKWSWGGGAEDSRSDGFTGTAPATGERVSNDDDHFRHASGTVGWQQPDGADIVATGRLDRSERGFPGPFGSDPIGAYTGVDRVSRGIDNTRQIGARVSHPWSSRVRQRIDANYTDISSDFTSPFGPSATGSKRFVGRVQEDMALTTAFSASAGVEFEREQGSSTFVTGATGELLPIRRSTLGTFAEARYVGSDRLSLTGGLRVERLSRDAVEPSFDEFSPRPPFPEQTVNSVNPKVAVSYVLAGGGDQAELTRIRASAGSGIRPPNAFEIAFTDNPNLKPERSRSVDAGIEQQFGHGAIAVSATLFLNRYDDLIVSVGRALADASQFKTDNISNAEARGAELEADTRLGRGFSVRANYTFLSTELLAVDGLDVAEAPFKVGDPLIRRPRHQGTLDVVYTRGRLTTFGNVTMRSRMLDVEPNFGASGGLFFTPGYGVLNLGGSLRINNVFDVNVRVLNATDHAYEETLGFPALGRSVIAGVRVAAGR